MRHERKKTGFTLIELLVVISIIALLMATLMPALGKARQLAKTAVCKSNIKQILNFSNLYANDSAGRIISAYPNEGILYGKFPQMSQGWVVWFGKDEIKVTAGLKGKTVGYGYGFGKYCNLEYEWDQNVGPNGASVPNNDNTPFACPSVAEKDYDNCWPHYVHYGMNVEFSEVLASNIKNPAAKVLFCDAERYQVVHDRHFDLANYQDDVNWNTRWFMNHTIDNIERPVVPGRHNVASSVENYKKGILNFGFADGHCGQIKRMDMTRYMFDNDIDDFSAGFYDQHRDAKYGFKDK